jgi:hypothetical protein
MMARSRMAGGKIAAGLEWTRYSDGTLERLECPDHTTERHPCPAIKLKRFVQSLNSYARVTQYQGTVRIYVDRDY